MEKNKKYIVYVLIGLLALALITTGVMGFLWGKSRAETADLKREKKAYLERMAEQDSIIKDAQGRIALTIDSMNSLVKSGVAINKGTERSRIFITEDKKKMNEEIDYIPTLSVSDQLKLFAKQSSEYTPR